MAAKVQKDTVIDSKKTNKDAPKKKSSGRGVGKGRHPNFPPSQKGRTISRPDMRKWDWEPVRERYVKGYDRISPQTGRPERYYPCTEEIAEYFNIPVKTIRPKCTEECWVEKREAWRAEQKRIKDEIDLQAITDAEIRIRTKSLKAAEKIIDRVGGNDERGVVSLADGAFPEDLSSLASALRRSQEVANVAIGIPKDGVKPAGDSKTEVKATVWAAMRESRQAVVVGVQVTTK